MTTGGPRHRDGNNRHEEHDPTPSGNELLVTLPGVAGNRICIKSIVAHSLSGSGTAVIEVDDGRELYHAEGTFQGNPTPEQGGVVDIAAAVGATVTVAFSAATLTAGVLHVTYALYGE